MCEHLFRFKCSNVQFVCTSPKLLGSHMMYVHKPKYTSMIIAHTHTIEISLILTMHLFSNEYVERYKWDKAVVVIV